MKLNLLTKLFTLSLWLVFTACDSSDSRVSKDNRSKNFCYQDVCFKTDYAISDQEKQKGLMFIRKIADDYAMVFPNKSPKQVTMWMKNTYVSLDMIFYDQNNQVVFIKQNATPNSLENITSEHLVSGVIEVKAGSVANLGIQVGDKINFR
jgi:uncharacterized membrane protein (UPF0127 family)